MLGSSSRLVRIWNDSFNILVQSLTTLLISSILDVIALALCSLTFGWVERCAFNRSSTIWRFSSNWTLAISSRASLTPVANLWMRAFAGASIGISSSGTIWQASSSTYTICLFCDTNLSRCKFNYSMLIFCLLSTYNARLSLACSFAVMPSCRT